MNTISRVSTDNEPQQNPELSNRERSSDLSLGEKFIDMQEDKNILVADSRTATQVATRK